MKRNIVWAVLFITVGSLLYIFSNQHGEISNIISNNIAEIMGIEQTNPFLGPSLQPLFFGLALRKYAHILLFALMGSFGLLMLNPQKRIRFKIGVTIGICYAYACIDELHQSLIPGRTSSITDTFIDLLGTAIGIGTIVIIRWAVNRWKGKNDHEGTS